MSDSHPPLAIHEKARIEFSISTKYYHVCVVSDSIMFHQDP